MSAPQTNLEKQKRRHRGPLIGIALGLLFIVGLAVFWAGAGSDTLSPVSGTVPAAGQPAAADPATKAPLNP